MGQHVNTFENGMNKDFNPIYQPDGTYYHMQNCNLISQDSNNFSVKDCLGNVLTFALNRRYAANAGSFDAYPMPIGFISFPGKLIVLHTNDETDEGGYGEIGMVQYEPYGEGVQPKTLSGQLNSGYIPLYHSFDLKFSKMHQMEGFGVVENEFTQRIYFTDNNTEPKVFNTSDPIYSTYITSGNLSATAGEKYMVIEGVVEYPVGSGDFYGPTSFPGSILFPGGNILTTNGVNTTYTATTGTSPRPKVIKYVAPQLLNWTPSRLLGNLNFNEFGTGNVYCGGKIYFYRLALSSTYTTSWSYGSATVSVGLSQGSTDFSATSSVYHNYVGAGTFESLINSTKSVKMTIQNVDTSFDYIELAVAEYDQLSDVPRQITIVDRQAITGSTMVLEHTGNVNLGDLTLSDITLFPASILKAKTIATSKNYLLAGNISEREELDVDMTGATITSFEYPMNVYYNPTSCSNTIIYSAPEPTPGVNPSTVGGIAPYTRWLVGGTGSVTYNGNLYVSGDVFVGVVGVTNYSTAGTVTVRPCVTRNRYTPILGGVGTRREDAIELAGSESCFWDYKSAAVQEHCTGYWSDEKYRFGILFYDLKGNPYYVRWIGDYTFPTANAKGGLIRKDTYSGATMYSLNPSGVKISNIQIPEEVVGKISGFSIVRAPRDPRIITQGLVVQCSTQAGSPTVDRPISWIFPNSDAYPMVSGTYSYLCPDSLVDSPLKGRFAQVGDTLESATWLDIVAYNASGARAFGGEEQVATKLIEPAVIDTTKRTQTITYFNSCNENGYFTTNNNDFQNATYTGATGIAPDPSCIGGVPYNLDSRINIGGKKNVVKLNADFNMYNSVLKYCSSAGGGVSGIKVLMNYCVSNPNQYGGSGENALANTVYISTGHFQPINTAVIAETCDTTDPNNYDYLIFNDIEIFGGDCFVNFVDYGYGLWSYNGGATPTFSYAWTFPCEGNANYALRRGRKTSTVGMYYTPGGSSPSANSIIGFGPSSESRLEGYSYNKGYTTEGQTFQYPALPFDFVNANEFISRIRFAGPKINGEIMDSFRVFLTNDYHDLEGFGGEINNIKVRDGRVIVWQNKMTSTVPILERQILSNSNGSPTTLGTGGVVDRYDPITSYFGNQHQWGLIETEYGFAWFDMRRKAFMVFGFDGTGLIEESQVGGLNGFFNEAFLEVIGSDSIIAQDIINDPSFSAYSDRPLMGVGITGVFDPKFKMTYMTFKFSARKFITVDGASVNGRLRQDFTIGYLHTDKIRAFVGFFDWFPAIAHNHSQIVLSANDPKITTQYFPADAITTGMSFVVGETYPLDNIEYICIQNVTLDGPTKEPDFPGSVYWAPINNTSQLWVNNQPRLLGQNPAPDYAYNTFFGRVVDNKLQVIVNPQTANAFEVQNIEQWVMSNVNYTEVSTEAEGLTAIDRNISDTNRNYRYIFDRITSSLPLSATGRIIKKYLKILFTKKNWTTDPRVVVKNVKIIQKLVSFFQERR